VLGLLSVLGAFIGILIILFIKNFVEAFVVQIGNKVRLQLLLDLLQDLWVVEGGARDLLSTLNPMQDFLLFDHLQVVKLRLPLLFVGLAPFLLPISGLLPGTTLPPQRLLQHFILSCLPCMSGNISGIRFLKPEIVCCFVSISFILMVIFLLHEIVGFGVLLVIHFVLVLPAFIKDVATEELIVL